MHQVTPNEIDQLSAKFVNWYLLRHPAHHMEADLRQEARIGVWVAAERFDGSRGAEFATYAWHWMRQRVTNFIKSFGSVIRVPSRRANNISSQPMENYTEPAEPCREIEQAIARVDCGRMEKKLIKIIKKGRSDAKCNPFETLVAVLKGDSQEEVAARSGITRQAVSLQFQRNEPKARALALAEAT